MGKKRPTEVIEGDKRNRSGERIYLKIPSRLIDITKKSGRNYTENDYEKISKIMGDSDFERYTEVHNHPIPRRMYEQGMGSIPSEHDFGGFLMNDRIRTMVIAQQDPETGKVEGYYFFRKTKKTPRSEFGDYGKFLGRVSERPEIANEMYENNSFFKQVQDDLREYRKKAFGRFSGPKPPKQRREAMEEIMEKYSLKMRLVPVKGFEFEEGTKFSPKNLESILAASSLLLLSLFAFITAGRFTAYPIFELSRSNGSEYVLLVLGFISTIIYFAIKKRNKNSKIKKLVR